MGVGGGSRGDRRRAKAESAERLADLVAWIREAALADAFETETAREEGTECLANIRMIGERAIEVSAAFTDRFEVGSFLSNLRYILSETVWDPGRLLGERVGAIEATARFMAIVRRRADYHPGWSGHFWESVLDLDGYFPDPDEGEHPRAAIIMALREQWLEPGHRLDREDAEHVLCDVLGVELPDGAERRLRPTRPTPRFGRGRGIA